MRSFKIGLVTLIVLSGAALTLPGQDPAGSLTDPRDGNTYPTVKIGEPPSPPWHTGLGIKRVLPLNT